MTAYIDFFERMERLMDNTPHSDRDQIPGPANGTAKPRNRAPRKPAHETAASAKPAAAKKALAKRTRVVKPATAKKAVPQKAAMTRPAAEPALTEPSAAEIERMIATAAYFLAEKRSFAPGNELADWLNAEHQIRQSQQDSAAP